MKHARILLASALLCTLQGFSLTASGKINHTEQSWHFMVYLDDSHIGYHRFTLRHNGNEQVMTTTAVFDVKFMLFTVYSYRHDNTEIWKGDCLKQLSSTTNDNGDSLFVRLNQQGEDIHIQTQNAFNLVNTCVRSFAYWNPRLLNTDQLLNSQTGELVTIEFKYLGRDTFKLNNSSIDAEHYQLQGENLEIDLWYSPDNQWLALQSTTENGSKLRYELKPETVQ